MDIAKAEQLMVQINSSKLQGFADKLFRTAIRYARLRVDWYLLSAEGRLDFDTERTIAHNAFISSCDILSRNMFKHGEDGSWRMQIGNDRKEIGDFACWIHLIIGLQAR